MLTIQTINQNEHDIYLVSLLYQDTKYGIILKKTNTQYITNISELVDEITLPVNGANEYSNIFTDGLITYNVDNITLDDVGVYDKFACSITGRITDLSLRGYTIANKNINRLLWLYDTYLHAFKTYKDTDILDVLNTLLPDDIVIKSITEYLNYTPVNDFYIIYAPYFKAYCKTYMIGGNSLYDIITNGLAGSPLLELWNGAQVIRKDHPLVINLQSQLGLTDVQVNNIFKSAFEFQIQNYL